MNKEKIATARGLARDFITACIDLDEAISKSAFVSGGHTYHSDCPKQRGHLRRVSMELTRALADMRKAG